MVCVFCCFNSFAEVDLKHVAAIVIASFPDSLITAIAPLPEAVAKATIVS